LVVDCGGGTVDVTVHELDVLNGRLEELHKATGGPHGSCGTSFARAVFELPLCYVINSAKAEVMR